MITGSLRFLAGASLGIATGVAVMAAVQPVDLLTQVSAWLALNLGHSLWLFSLVLMLYIASLMHLDRLIKTDSSFVRVVQLDQLSDVWIHVFIGIGVVWTAIGMRSALSTTLGTPERIGDGASEILGRLVDGGILLALTTTIVGAIGGYLMQLAKTLILGAALNSFFHRQETRDLQGLVSQLGRIEAHLAQLVGEISPAPGTLKFGEFANAQANS